jgi:hypothetical protein
LGISDVILANPVSFPGSELGRLRYLKWNGVRLLALDRESALMFILWDDPRDHVVIQALWIA